MYMKRLYTINTINNYDDLIYRPFVAPFALANPDIEIHNLMDDSLLKDTRATGMTPAIASRMLSYAKAAEVSGAAGVIVTCTSVNRATNMIRPLLSIPIINIEEPVAEMVVQAGSRIGVLATLPSSPGCMSAAIRDKALEQDKQVDILEVVVEGAFDILCEGDRERHDQMVRDALSALAKKVDAIAFAQISMSLLPHEDVGVPIFKIGESGLERIKMLMDQR